MSAPTAPPLEFGIWATCEACGQVERSWEPMCDHLEQAHQQKRGTRVVMDHVAAKDGPDWYENRFNCTVADAQQVSPYPGRRIICRLLIRREREADDPMRFS